MLGKTRPSRCSAAELILPAWRPTIPAGLPAGPGGALGAVEGGSWLAALSGVVVLALQVRSLRTLHLCKACGQGLWVVLQGRVSGFAVHCWHACSPPLKPLSIGSAHRRPCLRATFPPCSGRRTATSHLPCRTATALASRQALRQLRLPVLPPPPPPWRPLPLSTASTAARCRCCSLLLRRAGAVQRCCAPEAAAAGAAAPVGPRWCVLCCFPPLLLLGSTAHLRCRPPRPPAQMHPKTS